MRLRYDPKVVKLVDVQRGPLLSLDNAQVSLSPYIGDTGDVTISLSRLPGSGGISGSGALLLLKFQAVAPGQTEVSVL